MIRVMRDKFEKETGEAWIDYREHPGVYPSKNTLNGSSQSLKHLRKNW
jgi:hypothetical protein